MLLLLFHEPMDPLLVLMVHLWGHLLQLLLDLAELLMLLHLQLRLGRWGHLLEGSKIIFPESRCRPLTSELGNRIKWVLPQNGGDRGGGRC